MPIEQNKTEAVLHRVAERHEYPLVFVTISGAHLYGFPSPDSDYDMRGVHVLPAEYVLGLREPAETIERSSKPTDLDEATGHEIGIELDLVTHDVKKFMRLMLKRNGYVLEQLYSPLIIETSPAHEELKQLGHGCITRHHVHHYLGFAQNQWNLFAKEAPPRVKPLLYVYRVLLTGIHLMRAGQVEANLLKLNDEFNLPYVDELVARKAEGGEASTLSDADMAFHRAEYERLEAALKAAGETTGLPDAPSTRDALSNLLVRLRTEKP